MHIMVKCEDMIISRVLINNGSTLNACPMSIIEHLNVDTSLICPITMIIRAFDDTLREMQGEIELAIGIGTKSFMVNFQVIKVDSLYNLLLGGLGYTLQAQLLLPFTGGLSSPPRIS